jgi:membrane-associated phospholipid phosphatase
VNRLIVITFLICVFSQASAQQHEQEASRLTLRQGILRGAMATTIGGGSYLLYRNFAQPPTTSQVDLSAYQQLSAYQRTFARPQNRAAALRSDVALFSTLLLPVGELLFNPELFVTEMTHYGEALMGAIALTYLLKTAITTPRPYAYQTSTGGLLNGLDIASGASFSSGHAAMAFAAAGHLLWQDRLHWSLPAIGLATATATGIFRVQAGKHFPHDVLAGAAIGLGSSWLVHRFRRKGRTWVAPIPGSGFVFGAQWRLDHIK